MGMAGRMQDIIFSCASTTTYLRVKLLKELNRILLRNWTVNELLWGLELELDVTGHEANQNVF